MDHASIDLKYKCGSIHMAATSMAIDCGVLIDATLNTGRWAVGRSSACSTIELAFERWP